MKKKIISREKYFQIRQKNINSLLKSKELFRKRLDLVKNSRRFRVVYNTVWNGEPCLQHPDDLILTIELLLRRMHCRHHV